MENSAALQNYCKPFGVWHQANGDIKLMPCLEPHVQVIIFGIQTSRVELGALTQATNTNTGQ